MINFKNSFLHITGMARSGTTLIDKILNSHPNIAVDSQPFPFLYRYLKQEFFNHIKYPETYYVLNNLFNETLYSKNDFLQFLKGFEINKSTISKILHKMDGWSGQQTKIGDIEALIQNFCDSPLNDTYKNLLQNLHSDKNVEFLGSKEILTEEFTPYFIENGIKILLIIRDPRDVYTSLNFGKGPDYGGTYRPTLFHLRNWRKSIAIANTYKNDPNFLAIRYEDLLINLENTLKKITLFLNVEAFKNTDFKDGLKSSDGNNWQGNSSTHDIKGIDDKNYNKYKRYLNENTIKYIEFICGPEMNAWGYKKDFPPQAQTNIKFKEPYDITVKDLSPLMSSNKSNMLDEQKRLSMLTTNSCSKKEIENYFYSQENFDSLIKNLS